MAVAARGDIQALLRQEAETFDPALMGYLDRCGNVPARLAEAMRYSFEAGGKRLRPLLVLWSCEACGGDREAAMPAAMAVECVHTFSLIHDDLPALDNDDLRRGSPANHTVFGEALAVLAGDALLALAFEILAREVADPELAVAMMRALACATGAGGLIGGEAADIEAESLSANRALVEAIHGAKTAKLIEVSCRLGAMAAGADTLVASALEAYGHALGLAFQATDDLLDATGDSKALGKRTGKDAKAGKQTLPRAVGIAESRRIAQQAADQAVAALEPLGSAASRLTMLARFAVERES